MSDFFCLSGARWRVENSVRLTGFIAHNGFRSPTPGAFARACWRGCAGLRGSVALAVDDLPAGASAAFTPTSVVPPGSSSLELGNLDAVATGHYAVKVMGSSGADSTFRVLDLMLSDALPQALGLLSPGDGQTGASTSPILAWGAANGGPADYRVEVATDATFSTTVFSRTLSNQTSVTVEPVLAPLTTFYWRVRADNACGTGEWSQVRSFTTGVTFPEPYCSVSFPSNVEPITRVKFSGIDNRSCAAVNCGPALEDVLAIPGGAIEPGQSYEMRVEGNTAGNYPTRVKAFFDWNRNGSFETSEGYTIGSIVNSTGEDGKNATAMSAVPASLTPGPVRMRVTKKYSTEADACNTSGYGQAEDYILNYEVVSSDYSVGGVVSGLQGSDLVSLSLNGNPGASFGNGSFSFATRLADGEAYEVVDVSIRRRQCTITGGNGIIAGADVGDITVDCSRVYLGDDIFNDGFEP